MATRAAKPGAIPSATAPEDRWALGCHYGGVALDIAGNDPADGLWLAAFLSPWCAIGPVGGAPVRVRMVRSAAHCARLEEVWRAHRASGGLTERIACLRLDSQMIVLEARRARDHLHLVDPAIGCHIDLYGDRIELVVPEAEPRAQMALLGLVREAIIGAVAGSRPLVDMHAAAFGWRGHAFAIAGAKGAGKTSLLCHALASGPAALIANDRILVHLDREPAVAAGVPTLASVREGTVRAFPGLLDHSGTHPAAGLPPTARRDYLGVGADPAGATALLLPPSAFAGRLGAAMLPEAPLAAILLPFLAPEIDGWSLERLTAEDAAAALEDCLYGPPAGRDQTTLFGNILRADAAPPCPAAEGLRRLAATVPVRRCRLGPNAYGAPIGRLLEAAGFR